MKPLKGAELWKAITTVSPYARRILLYGPPGTGKSYLARVAGVQDSEKVYPVAVHSDLAAVELRGHFIQTKDGFRWVDGPATTAWRNGGRLVLDEIDRAGDDALSFLLGVLDDHETAKLVLGTTGEILTPHPDFTVWATMNGEPDDLPEALADRFPVTMELKAPNPEAFKSLPEDLRRIAQVMAEVPYGDAGHVPLRCFLEFARLREHVEHELAAQVCFGLQAEEILTAVRLAKEVDKR